MSTRTNGPRMFGNVRDDLGDMTGDGGPENISKRN